MDLPPLQLMSLAALVPAAALALVTSSRNRRALRREDARPSAQRREAIAALSLVLLSQLLILAQLVLFNGCCC